MKSWEKRFYFLPILCVSFSFLGCYDEPEVVTLPIVETFEVTNFTTSTASSGGIVVDAGGALIIDRGICWDMQPQPTTALATKNSVGQDTGMFVSEILNLTPNQQYFLRAYATNSLGTSYGNELNFFTDQNNTVIYKTDGRTVRLGDPSPILLDLSEDGQVDFTIFFELTANTQGDRLYAGMNPIGLNQVKSGPALNENFLNMGFLIAETPGSIINAGLGDNQRWTGDFGTLVIRKTSTDGEVSYEGSWIDSSQIVGVQHIVNGSNTYGWLRIKFDKSTEVLTLVDYAYDSIASQPILAGATAN